MYKIRIELDNIEPKIWRDIIVPLETTLDELHAVIQGSLAWQDYHVHIFEISGQKYESPDEENGKVTEGSKDERKFRLAQILKKGDQFSYLYDVGDNWQHTITVLDVLKQDRSQPNFPSCVAGERACPPEDFGGTSSYMEYLEVLADENHVDHNEVNNWSKEYNPAVFSTSQAKSLIGAHYVLCRERKGRKK